LVAKAAHRAIVAAPDRAEPFLPLANAYRSPGCPVADADERQMQVLTARARFLARVPGPSECPPGVAFQAFRAAAELTSEYERTNQFDYARAALQRSVAYAERVAGTAPGLFRQLFEGPTDGKDPAPEVLNRLRDQLEQATTQLGRRDSAYEQRAATVTAPAERFRMAVEFGLPKKAVELFKATPAGEFGQESMAVVLRLIEIELRAGELEQAHFDLTELDKTVRAAAEKTGSESPLAAQVRGLQGIVDRLAGNYKSAGESLTEAVARGLPKLTPDELKVLTERLPALRADRPEFGGALVVVGGTPALGAYVESLAPARRTQAILFAEADFYFARGVYALYEGNVREATARFEQAAKPQGVDLAELGNPARAAEARRYLELIREAAKP
jgi:tetratricopeptide (TPR) repeat protein